MRTIWDLRNLVEIGAYKSRHLCMLWRIKKKSKTHYDGGHLVEIGTYKSQHQCMLWCIKKKSKTHSARMKTLESEF